MKSLCKLCTREVPPWSYRSMNRTWEHLENINNINSRVRKWCDNGLNVNRTSRFDFEFQCFCHKLESNVLQLFLTFLFECSGSWVLIVTPVLSTLMIRRTLSRECVPINDLPQLKCEVRNHGTITKQTVTCVRGGVTPVGNVPLPQECRPTFCENKPPTRVHLSAGCGTND